MHIIFKIDRLKTLIAAKHNHHSYLEGDEYRRQEAIYQEMQKLLPELQDYMDYETAEITRCDHVDLDHLLPTMIENHRLIAREKMSIKADEAMASIYGRDWDYYKDDVWEAFSPGYRAMKYEEAAIADSKLQEVCHE